MSFDGMVMGAVVHQLDSILTGGKIEKIYQPEADEIVLNISNTFDAYFNFTHMRKPWIIANLKTDDINETVRRIVEEDTYALREAKKVTWKQLAALYGDQNSEKAFRLEDYQMYLFNEYLERNMDVSG